MKKFLLRFFAVIIFLIGLLYLTDYEYILKGIRVVYLTGHKTAFIDDFKYFDVDTIAAGTHQPWPEHKDYNTVTATKKLQQTNDALGTVAFLIIKNDSVWFENYAEGYSENSKTNSFSMAKSITSALLGKAIDDGFIESLEQPVSDFYPKFKGSQLTVGDLSSMASGLDWDESYKNPFGVTARAYYDDDIAKTILNLNVVEEPGTSYKYLSGNTELLAMVIQKAIGKQISEYLSESFWQPMGFSGDAIWQVDDNEHKMVKAYCCIGSNARDFARFGKLYKDYGKWNGKQILDSSFVAKSIVPRFSESPQYGYGFWLSSHLNKQIFLMRGMLGQYVITIPKDNIIIVRLGHQQGEKTGTPFAQDFYTYVEEAYTMINSGS